MPAAARGAIVEAAVQLAAMLGVAPGRPSSAPEGGAAVVTRSFTFLFSPPAGEELAAEHVIREHRAGRVLCDILRDPYVTDRCSSAEIARLLDHPEIVRAVGEDVRHERGR
jgi:hypothetical protein